MNKAEMLLNEYFKNNNSECFIHYYLNILEDYKIDNYEYNQMNELNKFIIKYFINNFNNINQLEILNKIIKIIQEENLDELLFNLLNEIRYSKKINYYKKGFNIILYIILPYKNNIEDIYHKIDKIIPEKKLYLYNISHFKILENKNILISESKIIILINGNNYKAINSLELNELVLNFEIFLKSKIIIMTKFTLEIYEIKEQNSFKHIYQKNMDFDNEPDFKEMSYNIFLIRCKEYLTIYEHINNNYQERIKIKIQYYCLEKTNFNYFLIFYDKSLQFYDNHTYENKFNLIIQDYSQFNLSFKPSLVKINNSFYLLISLFECYMIDIFKKKIHCKIKLQIAGIIPLSDNSFLIIGQNKLIEHIYFKKGEIQYILDNSFFQFNFLSENPIQKNNLIYFIDSNGSLNILKIILKN